jgi:hypothetical protein
MKKRTADPLFKWLVEQAEKTSWRELALEIGDVDEQTAYGWYRRGSIPKWRRAAVNAAQSRLIAKAA